MLDDSINPDLEAQFSHLVDNYDLTEIVHLLSRYLEGQAYLAHNTNYNRASVLHNASGFCIMMQSELEKLTNRA